MHANIHIYRLMEPDTSDIFAMKITISVYSSIDQRNDLYYAFIDLYFLILSDLFNNTIYINFLKNF